MGEILILSSTGSLELAHKIASALVAAGCAACVNIVPGVRSIYRWEGRICDESEVLLLIKSTSEQFEPVRSEIRRLHDYQIPEVIAVPIELADGDYLAWMRRQLG
jgi:periplasmic divalent cation tolerance protein